MSVMIDVLSAIVGIAMLVVIVGGITVIVMMFMGVWRFLDSPKQAAERRARSEQAEYGDSPN